eukprot:1052259-Rhodomonas_salina.1
MPYWPGRELSRTRALLQVPLAWTSPQAQHWSMSFECIQYDGMAALESAGGAILGLVETGQGLKKWMWLPVLGQHSARGVLGMCTVEQACQRGEWVVAHQDL